MRAPRPMVLNQRVQKRIPEWNSLKGMREIEHNEMIKKYCQCVRPVMSKSDRALEKSWHLDWIHRVWETEESNFTCLMGSLLLGLPYQPHRPISLMAGHNGPYNEWGTGGT
jgi:hypothetical protein